MHLHCKSETREQFHKLPRDCADSENALLMSSCVLATLMLTLSWLQNCVFSPSSTCGGGSLGRLRSRGGKGPGQEKWTNVHVSYLLVTNDSLRAVSRAACSWSFPPKEQTTHYTGICPLTHPSEAQKELGNSPIMIRPTTSTYEELYAWCAQGEGPFRKSAPVGRVLAGERTSLATNTMKATAVCQYLLCARYCTYLKSGQISSLILLNSLQMFLP